MAARMTQLCKLVRSQLNGERSRKVMEYVLISAIAITALALVFLALLKILIPSI